MKVSDIDEEYARWMGREYPRVAGICVLGDSLAAGWMVEGGEDAPERTWGDMVAAAYRRTNPALNYRSLARHRATTTDVRKAQLPRARADPPDIALVICGANDMLADDFDPERVRENVAQVVDRLTERGSAVFLLTTFDSRDKVDIPEPFGERVRSRYLPLRDVMVEQATKPSVHAVDLTGEDAGRDPAVFSSDGLHINYLGQKLIAANVFSSLAAHGF